MSERETVYVVDDNPGMLRAMAGFLSEAKLRVETYRGAREFLEAYRPGSRGCLVLDLMMPEMSGLELQERLLAIEAELPVIIVSGRAAVGDAVKAMKLGSFDFLEKPAPPELLLARVRDALEHDRRSHAERSLLSELRKGFEKLTTREKQVLKLVIAGKQSKEIADLVGLSVSTVDNHRARIMKKLKARTAADLARAALLVEPSLAFPTEK